MHVEVLGVSLDYMSITHCACNSSGTVTACVGGYVWMPETNISTCYVPGLMCDSKGVRPSPAATIAQMHSNECTF